MADYKDIIGTAVRNNAGNLSTTQTKELFFDTTNVDFKYQFSPTLSSWRTAGSLNTARSEGGSAGETSSAALLFGGYDGSPKNETESYNGTTWTEVNNLNTTRFALSGLGTYTAALGMGGNPPAALAINESWNGSAWTEVADLNTGRQYLSCAGATPAGLAFGGNTPSATAVTESWNGSAWTEVADLNTARGSFGGGTGTSTSALMAGGTGTSAKTELWNGSAWTETTDINTARFFMGSSKRDASNTTAIIFGGDTGPGADTAKTELWNGSSWSEQNDLALARNYLMGAGTSTGALAFGGTTPPHTTSTEEWTENAPVGAWSTQPTMNNPRVHMGASPAGTSTAALASGGVSPESSDQLPYVESYNGTA